MMSRLNRRCWRAVPRATTSPSDLLRRASEANIESTERKLLTAAAFSEAALEHAVLVGGTAVELHTGSYRPTDIDLVGYSRSGSDAILVGTRIRARWTPLAVHVQGWGDPCGGGPE